MEHIRSYSLEIKNIRVHNVYHMYIHIYLENFYYSCWKMHGSRGVIRWVERNQKAPIGETWEAHQKEPNGERHGVLKLLGSTHEEKV
jgi:hypothetical protein